MALGWRKEYLRYKDYFLNIIRIYQKKKEVKMFLEILLSSFTIIFFGLFALRPTLLTIAELYRQVKSKEETVQKLDQKINALAQSQTFFTSQSTKISLIGQVAPSSPSPETFIRQLEGVALKNNTKILGISVGEVVLKGETIIKKGSNDFSTLPEGAKGLSFSISANSDYFSLNNFLNDLEKLRRPIKIDNLAFNSSFVGEKRVLVLVISGRVPYLGDEK
jgi:hypothetical protein